MSPLISSSSTIESAIGTFRYEALNLPLPNALYALVVQVPDDASRTRLAAAMRGSE